jgi:hypothetical protein
VNRLLAVLLALCLGGGCAHTKKKIDLETLAPTVDAFHQRVRWKDYRFASRYVVPERQKDFEKALREHNDEKDLDVTDYEIEGVEMLEEGQRARVTSRLRWTRLPSVSVKEEQVTSEFVYRDGQWLLEKQTGGPFDGALP